MPNLFTLVRRGAGLAISASYTAASFLSTLGAVALIGNDVEAPTRAAFFLFLAVFSPLVTIQSQENLLAVYRNRTVGRSSRYAEEGFRLAIAFALISLATTSSFTLIEALILTTTVFTHSMATTATGTIQHVSGNRPAWAILAVLLAGVRVGVTWAALPWGPVFAFAAGSYAYWLATLLLGLVAGSHERGAQVPAGQNMAISERMSSLLFLAMNALTFQVDKYLIGAAGSHSDLADSGVITMLLLSPVSMVFATIYRQRTRALFDAGMSVRQRLPATFAVTAIFVAFVLSVLALLPFVWGNLVHLVFPFLASSYQVAWLFGLAVMIDRIALLLVFVAQTAWLNLIASIWKAATLLVICLVANRTGTDDLLESVYLMYVVGSLTYLLLVSILIFRNSRHADIHED